MKKPAWKFTVLLAALVTLIGTSGFSQSTRHNTAIQLRTIIQPKLKLLGLYDGALDGIWGPQTERAISDFESRTNLHEDGYLNAFELRTLDERLKSKTQFFSRLVGHWSGRLQCDSGIDWRAIMQVSYSNARHKYEVSYGHASIGFPRLATGITIAQSGFYMPGSISLSGDDLYGYRLSFRGTMSISTSSTGSISAVSSIQMSGYRGPSPCDLVLVPTTQKWRLEQLIAALPRNQDSIDDQETSGVDTQGPVEPQNAAAESDTTDLQRQIDQYRKEAPDLIADAVDFVQQGNSFDINFPLEYSKVRDFDRVTWNRQSVDVYSRFRSYVLASSDFATFHQEKNTQRQRVHDERATFLRDQISNSIQSIRGWVLENQLDVNAVPMLELINKYKDFLNETDLDALAEIITSMREEITSAGVPAILPVLELVDQSSGDVVAPPQEADTSAEQISAIDTEDTANHEENAATIAELTSERDRLRAQLDAANSTIVELRDSQQSEYISLSEHQAAIDSLNSDRDHVRAQLDAANTTIVELRNQSIPLSEHRSAISAKTDEIARLTAQLDATNSTIADLRSSIQNAYVPLSDVNELRRQLDASSSIIVELRDRIQNEYVPLSQFRNVQQDLTSQVSALNSTIVEIQDSAETYKRRWLEVQTLYTNFLQECGSTPECARAMQLD